MQPGAQVTIGVNLTNAAYTITTGGVTSTVLTFTNGVNGLGTTTRIAQLTLQDSASALQITPVAGNGNFHSTGVRGSYSPTSQSYTLTNTGAQSIAWTAALEGAPSWISLSSTGGTIQGFGTAPAVSIALTANADTRTPGLYTTTLHFGRAGADTHVYDVSLTVHEETAGLLVVTGSDLVAAGPLGGPFSPNSTSYTLSNTGGSPLVWSVAADKAWVHLNVTGGVMAAGDTFFITVRLTGVANNALTAGTYTATIQLVNQTNGAGSVERVAQVAVGQGSSSLDVAPATDVNLAGRVGGPFLPNSGSYTLTNGGAYELRWTAEIAGNPSWIALSQSGGALAAGNSVAVVAALTSQANLLVADSYTSTLNFTNLDTGDVLTRSVVLVVAPADPGFLSVSPANAYDTVGVFGGPFALVDDANASTRTYTLTNTGGQAIVWSSSFTSANGAFVGLTATSGTLEPGASIDVSAFLTSVAYAITPADLGLAANESGAVTGDLRFFTDPAGNGSALRQATLSLNTSSVGLAVTGTDGLVSSGEVGGTMSPTSIVYTLTQQGNRAVTWSAAIIDSPTWLTLSATGGTLQVGGSAQVTVAIDALAAAGLGVGLHTATVNLVDTLNNVVNTRAVSLISSR